jgi:hypothetical protein
MPYVRDDRETPLCGPDGLDMHLIWVSGEAKYFCGQVRTGQISLKWFNKFEISRNGAVLPPRIARAPLTKTRTDRWRDGIVHPDCCNFRPQRSHILTLIDRTCVIA